jgi:hypothetical protein
MAEPTVIVAGLAVTTVLTAFCPVARLDNPLSVNSKAEKTIKRRIDLTFTHHVSLSPGQCCHL